MINIFNYLENTFQRTTKKGTSLTELLSIDVAFSILFHSIVYTSIIYFLQTRLFPKKNNLQFFYKKLFITLVIIMSIGYPLRLLRTQAIYKAEKDEDRAEYIIFLAYKNWYFFG